MNTERVMERVRRLLAIANDPAASDNEQRIALEQAQRLMDKHAIEEWQLEENHDDVGTSIRYATVQITKANETVAQSAFQPQPTQFAPTQPVQEAKDDPWPGTVQDQFAEPQEPTF